MKNKVLIIQNSHEGPGIITQILREKLIEFDLIILSDNGNEFPTKLEYKAIIILGGPDSVNDNTSKMILELSKISEAVENEIPILGICLGCQILVKVTGGKVSPGKKPEVGLRDPKDNFYQVHITETGKSDPIFEGLDENFKVFELHGEVIDFDPSSGIQLLASGDFVRNQIIKVGDQSYGLLCHVEIIPEDLRGWFAIDPMLNIIDEDRLIEDFQIIREDYNRNGKKLIENFLAIAGF